MTQFSLEATLPRHVAVIMDGNNRYGKKHHLASGGGHRAGKDALDPLVEYCRRIGIRALTIFAFSSENWQRPQAEVDLLMQLLQEAISQQVPRMLHHHIQLRFIGDRSRLSSALRQQMIEAEHCTSHFDQMTLTIAVSYGGMWDMTQAAKQLVLDCQAQHFNQEQVMALSEADFGRYMSLNDLPPVDVLIRTGGDFRLSNFLLWQAAYAELFFTETLWPDFSTHEFEQILHEFAQRERRFGKTSEQVSCYAPDSSSPLDR